MSEKINHTERKHALLSASGATRWMNCTPSARLEENFPEKRSIFADEGSLAHEFADLEIQHRLKLIEKKIYNAENKRLKANELYTDEMDGEVDKYVTLVLEKYNEILAKNKDAVILIEQKLDFSHIVEKGFGTGDVVIISDGTMHIIDLKYGKGVRVGAEDNAQLKLYALGALRLYEMLYDIHNVEMAIIQPRMDNYSYFEMKVEDLNSWGENEVKPKAISAYKGEGEQVVGDWCRFCKAKPVCRAFAEENMKLAAYEFRDPYRLSDQEILDIYPSVAPLQDWAKAITEYMLKEAVAGKEWKGFKLVEGKSNRRWKDDNKVIELLTEQEFPADKFMVSKLAGLMAIEKLVGKKDFALKFSDLVEKPTGAPTLVPESDKRQAFGLSQAAKDFGE